MKPGKTLALKQWLAWLRPASDILVGTALLWILLRWFGDRSPVWAIISFIVVIDTDAQASRRSFASRLVYTSIGCGTGVLCLIFLGPREWLLPVVLALTALVCTHGLQIHGNWKIAPMTTALVVTPALVNSASQAGLEAAGRRAFEVFLGSLMALLMAHLFSQPVGRR